MKRFHQTISLPLIVILASLLIGPSASAQVPTRTGVTAASPAHTQAALGTNIPYQGQLKDNGTAANGTYDFQFKLYDDASAGSQVGSDVNQGDVTVTNGLFSVPLDFGSAAFKGEARYLEIGVRPGASTGAYTTLSPRRPLLAAPYALYSLASAGGGSNPTYGSAASAPQDSLYVSAAGNVGIGTTNASSKLQVAGTTTTRVLQITGGSDLAEPFAVAHTALVEPGMVVVLDPDRPGQLRVSNHSYDPLVAGVISGAGPIKPGLIMQQQDMLIGGVTHPVALTGKVYVKAIGPIQIGDLLTTATEPGYAIAASDRARAFGTTLGKAMSKLDKGTGLVLMLVALQ